MRLDDIDRHIVACLSTDGRLSFRELGERVGLSAAAAKRRVDRLREDGVLHVGAVLDPAAVGRGTTAFVELFCDGPVSPSRIRVALTGIDEVVAAYTVTGEADALLHVAVAGTAHLEQALASIRELPFVAKTRSVVVLSRLVERGVGATAIGDGRTTGAAEMDGPRPSAGATP